MSYNSKYTGQQVEALLDIVSQGGGTGGEGGEVQKTTETEILAMGFTKNEGTITEVKMNGVSKGASGVVDLGTVITEHQDISGKVDKVTGKQLSTEDFTTALKQKLDGLSNYDDTEVNEAVSSLQTQLNTLVSGNANDAINSFNEIIAFLDGIKDSQDLSSIIASIEQQIAAKMDKVTLANVATSGSYNDLNDKPTIPSAVTESTVSGWGFTKNTGTYSKPSDGIPKSDLASVVQTSLSKADTALQSHQDISGKQDKLVSGTNIKTINGQSILGSGDILIEGGGSSSSGEDKRFFTDFTVEMVIAGCGAFLNISQDASLLIDAARNQKIICIPYRDYNSGFVVAQYRGDDSYFEFTIQVKETIYIFFSIRYDDAVHLRGDGIKNLSTKIESIHVSDGEVFLEVYDNTVYTFDSDLTFLHCYLVDDISIGSTIQFITRDDFTLEIDNVLWANGIVPTIEPNTCYELSLTSDAFVNTYAVLIPFK